MEKFIFEEENWVLLDVAAGLLVLGSCFFYFIFNFFNFY